MRLLSLILLLAAVLLGITFALLNSNSVVVNYYVGTKNLPLSLLIVAALAVGVFIGWVVSLPAVIKLKMECLRLSRKHKQ